MQAELEDQILYMLSTATGSLLDNVALITTLDQSKTTWEQVNAMLKTAEETSKKIEAASAQFRPCSIRAATLYFVLNDLSQIDAMYQFSLDAYTDLFQGSIRGSAKSDSLPERIRNLNDFHTYAVYKYTSRGLFERHKLLLSLQMCAKILLSNNSLNAEEFAFFMRGGTVLDRSAQPVNPDPAWLAEEAWDNMTELEAQVRAACSPFGMLLCFSSAQIELALFRSSGCRYADAHDNVHLKPQLPPPVTVACTKHGGAS